MATEKMMTPEFRVSYPYVLDTNKNGKYSISMIFYKKDLAANPKAKAAFLAMKKAADELYNKAFPKDDAKRKSPFKDADKPGDVKNDDPNYVGSYYMEATTQFEPEVFDRNKQDIISKKEFYPGCYARARIHFYDYEGHGGGISCGFDAVQKLRDGEQIGEGGSAKDSFDDELGDMASGVNESDDLLL